MLTREQQQWIDHLSDKPIFVVPYDPRTEELFTRIKEKILSVLGRNITVEHGGASSLGISGQDEIDVAIAVPKEKFDEYIPKLEEVFGPVRSRYEDRARFEAREDGKKIDLKIVDENHPKHVQAKMFEKWLREHPEDLERYRLLKESGNGLPTKEYYRQKAEFINEIMLQSRQ